VQTDIVGDLSTESRYFYFGGDTLCYGQTASVSEDCLRVGGFPNLFASVIARGSRVCLPFDPTQIVENLRRERYMAGSSAGIRDVLIGPVIRDLYYLIRPFLGIQIRKHLQRLALRRWADLPFPRWPVDTTIERFIERLLLLCVETQQLDDVPFIWFWPDGASSCVIVTHDVETKAGLRFVPSLMDIDQTMGVAASFQIVPQEKYAVSRTILDTIRRRGFELNVHDLSHDGELFRTKESLLRGAELINGYLRDFGATGFRSARMHRNADWFDAFQMAYDMSIPNVAHLEPQRGGCCTVFPFFIGSVLELPLTTIQDYSLFHILGDYSIDLWKKQIDLIRARHGLISVLVHPDYVYNNPRALSAYKELLNYLSRLRDTDRLWITTPSEVNRWWRDRSQMTLVENDGQMRITGQGHKNARVAHLTVAGGRVVYRVDGPPKSSSASN